MDSLVKPVSCVFSEWRSGLMAKQKYNINKTSPCLRLILRLKIGFPRILLRYNYDIIFIDSFESINHLQVDTFF